MNMLPDSSIQAVGALPFRQTPRERLLDALIAASCALEEATAVFGADGDGIRHLEPQVRALRLSADALIRRLAD
jgi:alkylhydroperoxidase family enzyme